MRRVTLKIREALPNHHKRRTQRVRHPLFRHLPHLFSHLHPLERRSPSSGQMSLRASSLLRHQSSPLHVQANASFVCTAVGRKCSRGTSGSAIFSSAKVKFVCGCGICKNVFGDSIMCVLLKLLLECVTDLQIVYRFIRGRSRDHWNPRIRRRRNLYRSNSTFFRICLLQGTSMHCSLSTHTFLFTSHAKGRGADTQPFSSQDILHGEVSGLMTMSSKLSCTRI